jgi:hypothetical protein
MLLPGHAGMDIVQPQSLRLRDLGSGGDSREDE